MDTYKQTYKQKFLHLADSLVWGSLRLTPSTVGAKSQNYSESFTAILVSVLLENIV